MTEEELSKIVDAKLADALAARLEADRARVRDEVVTALRREAERAHYARINARHPIEDKYGGLGPEGHAARLKAMSAAAAKANAEMDAANARVVSGSLLEQRSRADSACGSAGFEVRPGRARS
jgi:hypothetical protein